MSETVSQLSPVAGGLAGLEEVGHSKQTTQCVKPQECIRAKVFKGLNHLSVAGRSSRYKKKKNPKKMSQALLQRLDIETLSRR